MRRLRETGYRLDPRRVFRARRGIDSLFCFALLLWAINFICIERIASDLLVVMNLAAWAGQIIMINVLFP